MFERERKLWDTGGTFGPFDVLGHSTSKTASGHTVKVVVKDSLWKGYVYRCFVDGMQVEEHTLSQSGSRALREMKEGSYIISTGKRTAHSLRNIKRTWAFELRDRRPRPKHSPAPRNRGLHSSGGLLDSGGSPNLQDRAAIFSSGASARSTSSS